MAKHTLKYLKDTISEHLALNKSEPFKVTRCCNADCGNSEDRKSVTGYCFQSSNSGPIIHGNQESNQQLKFNAK